MVNQAFRIKIAYHSKKEEEEEEENIRDRSAPNRSDKHCFYDSSALLSETRFSIELFWTEENICFCNSDS